MEPPIETFTSRGLDVCREERHLVMSFMRAWEKGQTHVRLNVGTPFRPHAWPRGAITTRLWSWRVATSWHWGSKEHINVLEARASLNCLQRRCRKTETLWSRFLLLTDSQVCTAILSKRKLLANSISRVFVAFCNSEDNPSDIPSIWRKVDFRRAQKLFARNREKSSAR